MALIAGIRGDSRSVRAFPGWWALLPVCRHGTPFVRPEGLAVPRRAREPAAGVDRTDQLSALSLALAAVGVFRHHQVRPAVAGGARVDIARERASRLGDVSVCREAISLWSSKSAQIFALCAGMVRSPPAGAVVVSGNGLDFRLPAEFARWPMCRRNPQNWRFHECLLDLSHEMEFAETCVDRDRRPLVLVWEDSTAGALLPGLRKAQEAKTSASPSLLRVPAPRR